MKYVLGLTGPTGSGKSTLCRAAEKLGWYVIDCDRLSREVTKEERVLNTLVSVFGADILNPDKSLNRSKLAEKAFAGSRQTELLNKTLLPFIVELIQQRINDCQIDNIILDAPTLYESGADSMCNDVCAVLSGEDNRLERILKRDGISEAAAKLRMSAGKNDEYYKTRTRYIIYNDKDEETVIRDFTNLLNELGGKTNG